ncbi:hypothetical protein [Curtobacterium sp. MCBD17_008]|uniref:hypothetical protein n=1 Tax=Curtobacterium sp. MCBD17_008 TaxID=2175656 RepID=UPI0011B65559|nr:hypothetical protein [Curtobacterium sp. MCBD17_008]
MSRLSEWWRRLNEQPRPQPTIWDSGQGTIPYPELNRRDLAEFHRCEEYLLREIVDARSWGRQVDARGVPFPTNGWLIMPGRVHSSLMDDTKGSGPKRAVTDSVVAWLADAGALTPLSEQTRDDIAASNIADRRNTYAGYTRDDGTRDWDHDMWQVDPERMLVVYPHLADANIDWKRAASE